MPDGGAAPRVTAITPASWDELGWNRAFDRGYVEGLEAACSAVPFIAEADHALRDVKPYKRKAIWQQAIEDVRSEHGDLPEVIIRAIAARRIVLIASGA